ncbi:MAG TPA: rhomboid family intramembrane serine protease [Xanthobacteraceae bacterium]|nr:rhomboid family intramembrane serine protease [Xanthobacteraceae bacterium]
MFPFIDTAPRASPPVLVLVLIAINTLVFLWMESLPPATLEQVLVHAALIPVRYTEPAIARQNGLDPTNWWPLLTNTFMHGGWLHLILNMWFLWIFGPAMEARFGRFGFTALYLGGAIAASLVHLLTHPLSTTPVLGASGAIAAVIGAHAVAYPRARVITIILIVFIPLFVPLPAVLFALIWFALQLLQGTSELLSPGMAEGVAWWAHIGGFAFGALFALAAHAPGPPHPVRTTTWSGPTRGRVPTIRPRDW